MESSYEKSYTQLFHVEMNMNVERLHNTETRSIKTNTMTYVWNKMKHSTNNIENSMAITVGTYQRNNVGSH